jgi:hypothetical protein
MLSNTALKSVTLYNLVDVTDASEERAGSLCRAVPFCSYLSGLIRNVLIHIHVSVPFS